MGKETFWTLLQDPAHWEFEIFLIVLFDGILGLLIWPKIKKFLEHYKSDDKKFHELHDLDDKMKK